MNKTVFIAHISSCWVYSNIDPFFDAFFLLLPKSRLKFFFYLTKESTNLVQSKEIINKINIIYLFFFVI